MNAHDTDTLIRILRANKSAVSHAMKIKPIRRWAIVSDWPFLVRYVIGYKYFIDGREVTIHGQRKETQQ